MPTAVEEKYDNLVIEEAARRMRRGVIPELVKRIYKACLEKLPNEIENISLEKGSASLANFSPGRHGFGEEAQVSVLMEKYPKLLKLHKSGKKAVYLYKQNGNTQIVRGKKTNINGLKSFDAMRDESDRIILYVLKTIDIGFYSDSVDGGHQENVLNELKILIESIGSAQLQFNDKPAQIVIMVDGRSSAKIIAECKMLNNNKIISIIDCESI